MEISFIPNWILKKLSDNFYDKNDFNILLSNLILVLVFLTFKSSIISISDNIPHFCISQKILHIDCPGCGITRGLCNLSNGKLFESLKINSLSFLIAFYIILQVPLRIYSLIFKKHQKKINLISKRVNKILIILLIINWITKLYINY